MGIKNLNQYLHKTYPDLVKRVSLKEFHGKRIAIDGHNWIYTTMASAQKRILNSINPVTQTLDRNECIRQALLQGLDFIMIWFSEGIIPVFVFDGKALPEKSDTRKERYERRAKQITDIETLSQELSQKDALELTPQLIETLRSKMRNCINISGSEWQAFFDMIHMMGIPFYDAIGDGEKLCSMLCIEGRVDAVYSADSDNLAYGCPVVLTGPPMSTMNWRTREVEYFVSQIRFEDVLDSMKMEYTKFLDFCIMCGCDYNTNIPNIGPMKTLQLLEAHESIDNLPEEYKKDVEEYLNHKRCRELFQYQFSKTLATDGHLDLDMERLITTGKEFFMKYELITFLPKFISIFNRLPQPPQVFISRPAIRVNISLREVI